MPTTDPTTPAAGRQRFTLTASLRGLEAANAVVTTHPTERHHLLVSLNSGDVTVLLIDTLAVVHELLSELLAQVEAVEAELPTD
jgi:hypothetical protein